MSTRRDRVIGSLFILAWSAALVVVVLRSGFLPTNDAPALLFNGVAAASIDDPRFAPFFIAHAHPTFHGFSEIVGIATPHIGWRAAHQLALCVIVVLTALGAATVILASSPRSWPLALVAGVLGLQHCLYLGLVQYQLAFALGCFAMAHCLRLRPARAGARGDERGARGILWYAVLSLILLASAVAHPFGALFAGVVCFAVVVSATPATGHARARAALWMVLAGTPSALVAYASSGVAEGGAAFWPGIGERVSLVLALAPGPAWRGVTLWAACLAGVAGVVGVVLRALSPRSENEASADRASGRDVHVAIVALGLSLLLLAIVGPRDVLGWQLFALRPLPFAAILLLAAAATTFDARWAPKSRVHSALTLAAIAYAAATLAWAWSFHGEIRNVTLPLVTRIERLAPAPALRATIAAQPRLPISAEIPSWTPLRRVGSLATIELGGGVAGYYGRATDTLVLRAPPGGQSPTQDVVDAMPEDAGPARDDYVRRLAALSTPLGALFASAPPRDLDTIEAAGWAREQRFDPDASEQARVGNAALGVLAARFQGCTARVRSNVSGTVRIGFMPMADATISADVVAGEDTLAGLGCGPMWFRFPASCANADASDRVYATLVRDAPTDVTCEPHAESLNE